MEEVRCVMAEVEEACDAERVNPGGTPGWTAHLLSSRGVETLCRPQGCSVAAEPELLSLPAHPPTTSLFKLAAAHLDDFGNRRQRLEPAWLPRVAAPLPLLQPNGQEGHSGEWMDGWVGGVSDRAGFGKARRSQMPAKCQQAPRPADGTRHTLRSARCISSRLYLATAASAGNRAEPSGASA